MNPALRGYYDDTIAALHNILLDQAELIADLTKRVAKLEDAVDTLQFLTITTSPAEQDNKHLYDPWPNVEYARIPQISVGGGLPAVIHLGGPVETPPVANTIDLGEDLIEK